MREIFKSGSVGGAPGNRCSYPELDPHSGVFLAKIQAHSHLDVNRQCHSGQVISVVRPVNVNR